MVKKVIVNTVKLIGFPLLWLNNQAKKTNWYQNTLLDPSNYPNNEWYRIHEERNYDIVNVGSSSALYAFDYSQSPVKAFNWALQPQSMEYSYKLLLNFHSILRPKGIILIPLGPFSGLSLSGKWAQTANDKYFGILYPELIDNYEAVSKRRNYPLFSSPLIAIKRLLKDIPAKPATLHERRALYQTNQYAKDAKRWIQIWKNEFGIKDLDSELTPDNKEGMKHRIALLHEMIEFCLERDLKPVIVNPPVHSELNKYFSSTFKQHYIYQFVEKANTDKIPFIDYMDSPDFVDDSLFTNSFFLSKKGALLFTDKVLKKLNLVIEKD